MGKNNTYVECGKIFAEKDRWRHLLHWKWWRKALPPWKVATGKNTKGNFQGWSKSHGMDVWCFKKKHLSGSTGWSRERSGKFWSEIRTTCGASLWQPEDKDELQCPTYARIVTISRWKTTSDGSLAKKEQQVVVRDLWREIRLETIKQACGRTNRWKYRPRF